MEFLNVIAAAAGSFVFGAIWYMTLSKPWMAATGIEVGPDGQPANSSDPKPYIMSAVSALLVAGMMRHVFATSPVDSIGDGMLNGFGIGLFFISPWIMMNNGFSDRPFKLTLIDGGYAVFGCTIIGAILMAF
ncbi:MAG: DUF1761 domain-containing protein [Pseudomonadota bacterium]